MEPAAKSAARSSDASMPFSRSLNGASAARRQIRRARGSHAPWRGIHHARLEARESRHAQQFAAHRIEEESKDADAEHLRRDKGRSQNEMTLRDEPEPIILKGSITANGSRRTRNATGAGKSGKDACQCPLERRERDERDKALQQTADGIPKPGFEQEDCGANEPEGVGRPAEESFASFGSSFQHCARSSPARAMALGRHRPVNYDAVCASAAISFSRLDSAARDDPSPARYRPPAGRRA